MYNDTIPDKYGFTDKDIIVNIENKGNRECWSKTEWQYIKEKYKELKKRRIKWKN